MHKKLLKSLLILAEIVEARDPYTGGHLWRVSQYSKLLAVKIGLSTVDSIQISLGAYIHDLGKVGIPDKILLKTDSLTPSEFDMIKTHPQIGKDLIEEHPLCTLVSQPIFEHHERPDGKGYPQGLAGDEISLQSLIVGICDAFDAITSVRPYRQGKTIEHGLEILKSGSSSQFESSLVQHIVDLGKAGDLSHIHNHSAEGIPSVICPTCGPIIAVPHTAREGDVVFCRACTGKLILHKNKDTFETEMVGKANNLSHLKPVPNMSAIDELLSKIPDNPESYFTNN